MTQDYDVEYTVKMSDPGIYTKKQTETVEVLLRHGYQSKPLDITRYPEQLQVMAEGYQDLFYGEDQPKIEHEAILKELQVIDPEVKLSTKWHYCIGWDWDFEFGEENDE